MKTGHALRSRMASQGLEIMLALAGLVPAEALYKFSGLLGLAAYYSAPKNRRRARHNITVAFSRQPLAVCSGIARQCFVTMALALTDMLRYAAGRPRSKDTTLIGIEQVIAARNAGNGVIGATAHFNAFPLLALELARADIPVYIIARHARYPDIECLGERLGQTLGFRIIYSMPARRCLRQCRQALDANAVVIVALDQIFRRQGQAVSFFNRTAFVPDGLLGVAARDRIPVLPMFSLRLSRHAYRFVIEPELSCPGDMPLAQRQQALAVAYAARLEHYVRAYPGQWMSWLHKPWEQVPQTAIPAD